MLSALRAQLYYLLKCRVTIVFVVLFVFVCMSETAAIWMHLHVAWFAEIGMVVGVHDGMPSMALWGSSFVGGSLVGMYVAILMVSAYADLRKQGFVKNLIQSQGGRATFAMASVLVCLICSAATVLIGVVVTEAGSRLAGVAPALPSLGDFAQWYVQVTLVVAAYATLSMLAVFVFKSEIIGVMMALFFGGGMAEGSLQFILANIPSMPPAIRDCLDGYLAADMFTLSAGGVCDPLSYAQSVGTIVIVAALCVLVMRRRSIG